MTKRGPGATNRMLAIGAGALGALALVAGDTPAPGGAGEMAALELATRLRADPAAVVVLDVRDRDAYEAFHVPTARSVEENPPDLTSVVMGLGVPKGSVIVVAGGPDADPRAGWLSLRRAGFPRAFYMPDILTVWLDNLISPTLSPTASLSEREAWEEQAELSRYFGGFPRVREAAEDDAAGSATRLKRAKRRGCAF